MRAKKSLDQDLNDFRNQQAFFDLDPTEPKNSVPLKTNPINLEISQPSNNRIRSASTRRSVSFAPEVNVFNEDEDNETTPTAQQMENDSDEHFQTTTLQEIQQFSFPEQNREKFSDSDYFSVSSNSSNYEHQNAQKSALPSKYRLPIGSEILVNKMDSNLRMLIIKELSKTGHNERPLSRMSKSSRWTEPSRFDAQKTIRFDRTNPSFCCQMRFYQYAELEKNVSLSSMISK